MSSRGEQTRKSILEAAWELFEETGDATLAEVAEKAGVSRQAVYLHFGSRGGLLLALVQHIDETSGLPALIGRVQVAPTPREQLMEYQRVSAQYCPTIHDVAMAMDRARAHDEDVAAAYEDRMQSRRDGLRTIVAALHESGELRDEWTIDEATDALWSLGTPHAFEELVRDRGWSLEQYERWLLYAATTFLED